MSFDSLDAPPKTRPETMTVKEAAAYLGRGEWAVQSAIKRGEIKAKKVLGRWYLSRESVEALLRIDERAA